jgi:hypothetical protein
VTKVVTRSRRSFRGAAERLLRVERYADHATRLAAVAAALANPECNAWSNYWKIRLLGLMATGTGIGLFPVNLRSFNVIEEIPGALAQVLGTPGRLATLCASSAIGSWPS